MASTAFALLDSWNKRWLPRLVIAGEERSRGAEARTARCADLNEDMMLMVKMMNKSF
jgi:hypothetical protein